MFNIKADAERMDQQAGQPAQRWVLQSRLKDNGPTSFTASTLLSHVDNIEVQRRISKPSYHWEPDEKGNLWKIWFKESNLTIQIDSYSPDGDFLANFTEIDVEECNTAGEFADWMYHLLGKRDASPEMLWALLEVYDWASRKTFGSDAQGLFNTQK
jgi:hypothetical protein